jgi:hypothetical protein
MSKHTNTDNTESIKSLIDVIDKGKIVLPEFQRDFVWEVGRTYDLFDSLVRDIFIGAVIYGIPSFDITVREIDTRPRKGSGSREKPAIHSYSKEELDRIVQTDNFRMLLDGQQRITSLYRACKGFDSVWFIAKRTNELPSESDFAQLSLEELLYEFAGEPDRERLSVNVAEVYSLMDSIPNPVVLQTNFYSTLSQNVEYTEAEKSALFNQYWILISKIQDLLKAEKLLSYYMLNTNSEKFALFFERSNSLGLKLNFVDILAAKLYRGFNLREHIDEFESKHPTYGLDKEIIVRAISYIVSGGKDIDKSSILANLTAEHFQECWANVCCWYRESLDFLYSNHFIISQSWMPYSNMLLPLMMFLREIGGNFSSTNDKQMRFIRYWYWASVFAERYSGSSNEVIIQDARVLTSVARGHMVSDRTFFARLRSRIADAEDLRILSKKASALYRGVLNLLHYDRKGLPDWKNNGALSFNSSIEDHHIFPKHYIATALRSNEEAQDLTDSVANRTLIPKLLNITIGAGKPSVYLQKVRESNPRLEESLERHAISNPGDLINGAFDDQFTDFLQERAKHMLALVHTHVEAHREAIFQEFFQDSSLQPGEKIRIFALYYGTRYEADWQSPSGKVYWEGQQFDSVSAAAGAVKNAVQQRTDMTANGWEFWKYYDQQGIERSIDTIRR